MKRENEKSFSVIMPIYNTREDWLREAIESVINQSVGFEDNVQLILVNDGSTTDVETVCMEYVRKYPANMEYVFQENGGVSKARNKGLEFATGKYINFLDADDVWEDKAFRQVEKDFEKYGDAIDVVVGRLLNFGDIEDRHPLDFRFNNLGIVDVEKNSKYIQSTIGNCFIRRDVLFKNNILFKPNITYAEDTLFITEAILYKRKYALEKNAEYRYRRQNNGGSLSQDTNVDRLLNVGVFWKALKALDNNKEPVSNYLQSIMAYQLQWLLWYRGGIGSAETIEVLRNEYKKILSSLKDNNIKANMEVSRFIYAMKLKYGDGFYETVEQQRNRLKKNGVVYYNPQGKKAVFKISLFEYDKQTEQICIEGTTNLRYLELPYEVIAISSDNNRYVGQLFEYNHENKVAWDGTLSLKKDRFKFLLPLKNGVTYTFYTSINGGTEIPLIPNYGISAKLNPRLKGSYWVAGKHIFSKKRNGFRIQKYNIIKHFVLEKRYQSNIKSSDEIEEKKLIVSLRKTAFKHSILEPQNREIWVVTDRPFKAGDNAENFYKYAKEHNNRDEIFFSVKKETEDYNRLSKYGKILEPESYELFKYYLRADKLISSHFDGAVLNPLRDSGWYVMDYYNYDFIYLNHGVMPGDLSNLLNKLQKNIKMFVTSSDKEYDSILQGEYYYSEKQVKQTGMCRYDAFKGCKTKKEIVFLPTWRKSLAGKLTADGRDHEMAEGFKSTEYYAFYNGLINDDRLIDAMRKHGYQGAFYVHPALRYNAKDFEGNEQIKVHSELADYEKILREDQLLITDYSSVAFDFASQRKPIVYSQFDDAIEKGLHSYNSQGYFIYSRDGFGPITHTIEETVDEIVRYIEQGCKNDNEYMDRASDFFKFNDYDNCKRTYEEVLNLK